MRSGYAHVNDTKLYYELHGAASKPGLVLIHGFTLDRRMWDDQVAAFSEQYSVLRYDMRGFGASAVPEPGAPYSHTEDLKALLDHLGIPRAHILGLSLGAAVAIELAFAYPHVVSSLVAVDPVLWGYSWSKEYEFGHVWAASRERGIEAARALWLAHPLFAPTLDREPAASNLKKIVGEYSGWHWANRDPGTLPEPLAITHLERITAPTLAIIGERDLPDHHAIAGTLSSHIPDARLVVLPRAGHMSNMEVPEEFNGEVLSFLETLNNSNESR